MSDSQSAESPLADRVIRNIRSHSEHWLTK
jgi:hypothetical protein